MIVGCDQTRFCKNKRVVICNREEAKVLKHGGVEVAWEVKFWTNRIRHPKDKGATIVSNC